MTNDAGFTAGLAENGTQVMGSILPNSTSINIPGVVPTTTTTPNQRFFTDEDLAKARAQEKDKLYPQIESLKAELAAVKQAEEARQAEIARQAAEAEEAERRRREEETDVRTLLQQKEAEWEAKFQAEKAAREQAAALLEREQAFQALQQYRNQRMNEVRDSIIPELLDLISGSTQEEIESSIAGLQERSALIIESATQAAQQSRQQMAGPRVTSPAAGPLDTDSGHKQFSAEDISAMSFADYVKNRNALLGQAASQRNRGMFG